ncbi:MAG: hypothetical protein FJ091_03520 [Deltaproteobacteria bacterium]|nr:hypothetical protein [Deltaproteobacteria bacterium]
MKFTMNRRRWIGLSLAGIAGAGALGALFAAPALGGGGGWLGHGGGRWGHHGRHHFDESEIRDLRALRSAFERGGIETSAWPDPVTTAAISGSLVLVAIVAGVMPALRAARVSPAEALRAY